MESHSPTDTYLPTDEKKTPEGLYNGVHHFCIDERQQLLFRFDLASEGGGGTDRYHWNPTTFLGLGLSYKLLDEGGNLLALYDYNSKSLKNKGTIYVTPELPINLVDAVMLTLAAILEKRRRESPTTQYYCL